MESKVNLAVVGAFVLALAAAGIGAVLWLSSGRLSQKTYHTYLAYFPDSVSGLSARAQVKLRGVDVGSVQEIALDPEDPARVRVVLSIEAGTPVKEDTYAVLRVYGLTGIGYVELGGGSRSAATLGVRPGDAFPIIPTRPSLFTRLDVAATSLIGDLGRFTTSLNETLDPETRQALRSSAVDLARVLHNLALRSREIDAATVSAAEMLRNGARASAALPGVIERLGRSADAVERMGNEFAQVGIAAQGAVQDARGAIGQVRAEVVPDVQRLVVDLRETSASLGRVSAELERDPSAVLVGRAVVRPGPGE